MQQKVKESCLWILQNILTASMTSKLIYFKNQKFTNFRHMNLSRAQITGEFNTNCLLSDYPKLQVFLNIPQEFEDYSFHTCALDSELSLQREKLLEFVPPNGKSTIMSYNLEVPNVQLPFEIHPTLTLPDVILTPVDIKLTSEIEKYCQNKSWNQSQTHRWKKIQSPKFLDEADHTSKSTQVH